MAQFTVHRNKNPKTARQYPYLIDIQNDLFEDLRTRVVIPAVGAEAFGREPLKKLMPVVTIENERYLLLVPQLAGIAKAELGESAEDLGGYRNEIVAALDFLVSGV